MKYKVVTYDLQKEIIPLTKCTIDRILKTENAADALALYTFYAYTAVWQGTDQAWATTEYAKTGLNIGRTRMTNAKRTLKKLGLIEDVRQTNIRSGSVDKWYIRVKYLMNPDHLKIQKLEKIQ
jgi:hypothetical protein